MVNFWLKFFITLMLFLIPSADAQGAIRPRRHRNDKAKLIRQYLKKNGRLEGMVRLVDGAEPHEGQLVTAKPR